MTPRLATEPLIMAMALSQYNFTSFFASNWALGKSFRAKKLSRPPGKMAKGGRDRFLLRDPFGVTVSGSVLIYKRILLDQLVIFSV